MLLGLPKTSRRRAKRTDITDVTLRDFSGGLLETDNDSTLQNKFATKLVNMMPETDRSMSIRYGTKEFASCSANIVNMVYFQGHIVAALEDGTIEKVDSAGTVTAIWNSTIAAALPGAPSGWSGSLTIVDFTEFRGELVVTNGVDKPILLSNTLTVTYLQDLATSSNVNTPITKYCATVANYTVLAGITNDTTIYISSTGTSGTWPGDPAPNDATSFDVGAYTGQSSSDIHALGSFKNFLVVYFDNFSVLIQLGQYDGANHTPAVIDTYPNLGTINHKCLVETDTDIVFPAYAVMASAEKNVFSNTLVSNSTIADNLGDLYPQVRGLVDIHDPDCFIVNNPLQNEIVVQFHKSDSTVTTYAVKYTNKFKRVAWAEYQGWNFTSACTSEAGRVFFGQTTKIYQWGNGVFTGEDYGSDYIASGQTEGTDITFDWEFPWIDAGNRTKVKQLRYLELDTTGTSYFTLQTFVNNMYKDANDNYVPLNEMEMVGGDRGGYGNNPDGYGGDGYGLGRRTDDERFMGFPARFKIIKLRIKGATKDPLRVVSISLIYARGTYGV